MFTFLVVLLGMEFTHSEGGKIFVSLLGQISVFIFPSIFIIGLGLYIFGKRKIV